MMNRVRLWVRSIIRRRRLEREMQEEMAEHLERATARLMARGLSAAEARREAALEFGNVAYLQEEARDARGGRWVDALIADSRFALRQFGRKPGMTITILAVLALGMSIDTALFSFLQSFSVQPPPGIPRAEGLVRIRGSQTVSWGGSLGRSFSYEELQEYRGLTDHFSDAAGWTREAVTLDVGSDEGLGALPARATFVTESYFRVLGVQPILGPGLPAVGSADPAALQVAVIGHAAWDRLFGRSPDVVGATLRVNGVPFTIVGVAPPRFRGVLGIDGYRASQFPLWLPLSSRRLVLPDGPLEAETLQAAGLLRPGVDLRAATSAARVVAARAAASSERPYPRRLDPVGPVGSSEAVWLRDPTAAVAPLLMADPDDLDVLTTAIGVLGLLVLLVTCTNVSALLTGLAMARRREIAMRLSLGAARTRIIRQLLTESVLLATAAGAVALGIVWILLRAVVGLIPGFPFEVAMNWSATVFTFGVALAVGVLFGLSPALHATRLAMATALKDSTTMIATSRAPWQRGLVVAQIAFTQPLIVGLAALLVLVLGEHQRQRPNEHADHIISLRLRSSAAMERGEPGQDAAAWAQQHREKLQRLRDRLSARLDAVPGVAGAVPDLGGAQLDGYSVHPEDRVEGGVQEAFRMSARLAAPGFFDVMGPPIVRGRAFTPTDAADLQPGAGEVAVIIGADLARRLWPGAEPIGRRLRSSGDSQWGPRTLVVIGVVEEPADRRRDSRDGDRVYLPPHPDSGPRVYYTRQPSLSVAMLIRTAGLAQPLIPTIRGAVQDELPRAAITEIRTVAEIETEQRRILYQAMTAFAGGGFMALFVSAIGLYAVVSFTVGRRTTEIAVRMALGARPRQIVGKFAADGLSLSVLGLLAGLPFSLLGLRILPALLDYLPSVALSPVAAMATFGVLAVATAATWIPARRAASVHPAVTLRRE